MKYLSKLLLFGEYTIINGSRALAMPYGRFFGQWEKTTHPDERLLHFADYLDRSEGHRFLRVAAFRQACREGWIFQSNIPLGYGLGSSGALCAAVYDRFAKEPISRTDVAHFSELKRQLARMESFFHGSSSGTDPLICYLNFPVVIHPETGIQQVAVPRPNTKDNRLFLLDTGLSRATGPLVDRYLEKCKQAAYAEQISTTLTPAVDRLIDDYLSARWPRVASGIREVSTFQRQHFLEMIPVDLRSVWDRGLQTGDYALKLCGAGGGGFLLGVASSQSGIEKLTQEFPCYFL